MLQQRRHGRLEQHQLACPRVARLQTLERKKKAEMVAVMLGQRRPSSVSLGSSASPAVTSAAAPSKSLSRSATDARSTRAPVERGFTASASRVSRSAAS